MAQAQMIEGTTGEVIRQIQQIYPGQKLRVFVEPEAEEEDLAANVPAPPDTIRDRAHLIELLHEGMQGPLEEFTDASMEEIRQEVHRRYAARQKP